MMNLREANEEYERLNNFKNELIHAMRDALLVYDNKTAHQPHLTPYTVFMQMRLLVDKDKEF